MASVADALGLGPTRTAEEQPNGSWLIRIIPPAWTGFKGTTITLTAGQYEGYRKWVDHELYLHEAIPALTPDEREKLMTGITPGEWQKTFGDSDE